MRTLSRLFILGVILLFFGCATVCPDQAVVEMLRTPYGPMAVETGRDTYCEERHDKELFLKGEGWITKQEYEALVKEYEEKAKEAKDII